MLWGEHHVTNDCTTTVAQPKKFVYVNNRLEGNAVATIDALVEADERSRRQDRASIRFRTPRFETASRFKAVTRFASET